ncbi:MAG: NADH-quinone oxidoreductase subunit NuoF [Anaerolineales bacterium]|nr:MAG: NADH-quinone oxidoreductase subunit NuoF [Anaerolineales bacterium]
MEKFLLRNVGVPNSHEIDVYIERGGYQVLAKALKEFESQELVSLIRESGLRGRGGAGFPTGVKWSFLPKRVYPRYLVCNADEGEPGTFKDRVLIEYDPHGLIEGIVISSYACEVEHAFIYIRGEYVFGAERLEKTVAQAYERGYLGKNILGSGYDLELTVHRGAGSYVCGEETALLTSLEGDRGHPKLKPPFPASQGVYRKPTIINNVETLFNVPFIVEHGAEWYKGFGTERSAGLKLFCISGHVNKPGVYELPLGTPMMTLINDYAGGPSKPIKTVIPGGSSTPMLPADVLDTLTLDYEAIATAGSMLGSGAVIVIGEGTCIVQLVERLAEFYRHESCGKCIPCREGTDWLYKIMRRIEHGQGREEDIDLLLDICDNIGGKSFCPLGDAALGPITSSIKHFRDEYLYHIREKRCMNGTTGNPNHR